MPTTTPITGQILIAGTATIADLEALHGARDWYTCQVESLLAAYHRHQERLRLPSLAGAADSVHRCQSQGNYGAATVLATGSDSQLGAGAR